MAAVTDAPRFIRVFGARGAVIAAPVFGLLLVGMGAGFGILIADRAVDWLLFAAGVTVGIPLGIWSSRSSLIRGPAGQWALVGGVVGGVLLPDRGVLMLAGALIPIITIGVRSAWPWHNTIERWS